MRVVHPWRIPGRECPTSAKVHARTVRLGETPLPLRVYGCTGVRVYGCTGVQVRPHLSLTYATGPVKSAMVMAYASIRRLTRSSLNNANANNVTATCVCSKMPSPHSALQPECQTG
eukprot:6379064-Pyramimonas_sp.AAC.1